MNTSPYLFLLVVSLLLCCSPGKLHGQGKILGVPEIVNFSKTTYNAGTQNWCVLQDESGILLVGNNKGILEFDGSNWRLFELPNRTIVRSLASSLDGKVYVGAQDELGYLAVDGSGQLGYESLADKLQPEDRSFEDVWKIFAEEDRVYFGSKKALFLYEDEAFQIIRPSGRFENFFLVNDQLFAQDTDHGLMRWQDEQFVPITNGERFRAGRRIAALFPFRDQFLLISDVDGLFFLNEDGLQAWETPSSSFLRDNSAYCATSLPNGDIAIGTAHNGLLVIDSLGHPKSHINKDSGLQNNTILSIVSDQQGNFWLGLDNGIDYVKVSSPLTQIRSESGIEGTGYSSLVFGDRLYLATNQSLFYQAWPLENNGLQANTFTKLDRVRGQVWGIQELDGRLIANMHEGAFIIENDQIRPISAVQGSWKFIPLQGYPNHSIQGAYTGLYLYQRDAAGEWALSHKLDGFDESARIVEQDQTGHIWVSHAYKGLYKIDLSSDLSSCTVQFYDADDGLPSNINISAEKIQEEVVFSTPEGVYRYDEESDRFIPYDNFNTLLANNLALHRLLEDQTGRIWFSAGHTFGFLDIQEQGFLQDVKVETQYYNHMQEELVDGFEHILHIDDYHVLIATEKGFVNYDPHIGNARELAFPVLIREVSLLPPNDTILYSGGIRLEEQNRDRIELPNSMNSLRFYYSSPFFEHIGQIEYRYRLPGYQDEWSDWSNRTEKEFTNLPHGTYIFEVEARNTYGQISAANSFEFTIKAPWYASAAAKLIYFLLGGFLLAGLLYYNSRHIAKEKASLERQQAETLARKEAIYQEEREKSEAEIMRLRNENLRSDVQHKNAQLASATMHLVQKSEMMLKLKQDLDKLMQSELASDDRRKVQHLIHSIEEDIRLDNNWGQFEAYFDQVHENFLQGLRKAFPQLTPKDQKLCAYLRMNLSTKEIAPLMNISIRGVEISRYRLRKKLNLDTETNLTDYIMRL